MKSYTDRHWASVKWKNTVENVLAQFFNRVFLIWCGESHWRNRPKVYEYRGSMPICIVCQPLQYSLLLLQQLANPYHYIKKHRQYYHWPCTCSPGISKISNSKVCKKCKNQCKQSTKYKWNYCQYSKDSF